MSSKRPSLSHAAEFYGSTEGLLHIGPGCIVWLPKDYQPRQGSTLREPPEGAFGHPILVLSVTVTDAKNAIIYFATLTSFTDERWNTGTDIIDISKPRYRDRYVKVSPYFLDKKKTAITPPPLTLEHRQEKKFHLRQTSFVYLGAVYSAQLADLCVYDVKLGPKASLFRLNKESFKHVWGRISGEVSGVGMGAPWTWVPTEQLRNDFAKCAIRVRDDALKASATTMASARSGIDCLMLPILRLLRTIDSIGVASFSQLGVFPHHLLLHCAELAVALATLKGTTTTPTHTIAVACMLYAAVIMISHRLSPLPTRQLSVHLDQVARKRLWVGIVCAELMGEAALFAGIVFVGFAAKKSAEARDSPVQAATASMAAGMSGLEGQDDGGWTTVSYQKRRR